MLDEKDKIKDPILRAWEHFRLHYRSPFHVHSYADKPDMALKQCVVCKHVEENVGQGFYTPMDIAPDEEPKLQKEPLEWYLDPERANVPQMRQRRSGRLYEAHKDNIRMVLDHHGVLMNDGWSFVNDELIEDLAGVK